ncbi:MULTISPECIES: SDR family NAD(P)-dependent oxidoreductase [Streptomyces]|uniref:SDR family NAD(P)-dependent oxidoreductase n=1 Tax=Streptomyces TaxID=1883 RepID=UPI000C5F92E0|nr:MULTISPECIES: SDR family NAD(P)-dependent oxidoreductase [Streptomyces]PIB07633.1 hypothetical protein B1C81_19125 [Streptomyces sp. HG99]
MIGRPIQAPEPVAASASRRRTPRAGRREGRDQLPQQRGRRRTAGRRAQEDGTDAIAIQADVSDPEQTGRLVDQVVERCGKLDILVSNAGIEHFGRLDEITP